MSVGYITIGLYGIRTNMLLESKVADTDIKNERQKV